MSLCVSCGMDQETGLRVGLADDLSPPPPPRPQGPPIHIALIGGLVGTVALILLLASLVYSVKGPDQWQKYGWLCLALVSGFGIYAAVQFIRGRSAKLLMTALTLGVVIDLMVLVALPMLQPVLQGPTVKEVQTDDPDLGSIQIEQAEKQIDLQRVELGVSLIMIYAALSWYLMSPPVKKYIHPRAMERASW
jgi:hypothetical protein